MSDKELDDDEIRNLAQDEDISAWFKSRDPNRKKINPFLDPNVEEQVRGRSSINTPPTTTTNKQIVSDQWNITYQQYTNHISNVSKQFFMIGMSIAFVIAIVLSLIF